MNLLSVQTNPTSVHHFYGMTDEIESLKQVSSEWRVSEAVEKDLFTQAKASLEQHEAAVQSTPSSVSLATVSTFITKKSTGNFVVPAFAVHWGVICQYNDDIMWLIHLLFDVTRQTVKHEVKAWNPELVSDHQITQVGTTKYTIDQIVRICDSLSVAS